jgi:protein-disulfide isomerase
MRAGGPRALLLTAALAAAALLAGCVDQGDPGRWTAAPTSPASTSADPGTDDANDLAFPSDVAPPDPADVLAPSTADATGGIPVSVAGVGVAGEGDVVVDVYLDFMCPYCGRFEQQQSDQIDALLSPETGPGDVTVVYHVVSIMDGYSRGAHYSSRAANAASVVADQDPEHFLPFVVALFDPDTQPTENSRGTTDEKIAQLAEGVGVPAAVTAQFTATADFEGTTLRTFVPWTTAVTTTLPVNPAYGGQSVPTILINGERWEDWQTGQLSQAVDAARAAAGGEG